MERYRSTREQGFRRVHSRGNGESRARRSRGSSGVPASGGPAGGCQAPDRGSICGARCARASARAATSCRCPAANGAGGSARSSCSATSAGRWSATRACCCSSPTRSAGVTARLEAFLFSTRLTRITTDLRVRGLDAAVAAVSRSVPDWSGGTRIGESLRQFHMRWTRRVLRGGPVVLLISDGWDRGDPQLLARSGGAAAAELPSADLAQPADRHRRLRAADARTPGGAAVRGRLPAGADADEPRRPRGTLEHACASGAEATLMDISGSYTFNAPPDRVWDLLMDPGRHRVVHSRLRVVRARRRRSLPRARSTVALAAITGNYEGVVTLSDKVPPHVVSADGRRAGPRRVRQGDVRHHAARRGRDDDRGREGRRPDRRPHRPRRPALIGGVSKMMLDRFFACLQAKV